MASYPQIPLSWHTCKSKRHILKYWSSSAPPPPPNRSEPANLHVKPSSTPDYKHFTNLFTTTVHTTHCTNMEYKNFYFLCFDEMAIKYKNTCQTNQTFFLVRSYMIFKFNLHTLVKFRLDSTLFILSFDYWVQESIRLDVSKEIQRFVFRYDETRRMERDSVLYSVECYSLSIITC